MAPRGASTTITWRANASLAKAKTSSGASGDHCPFVADPGPARSAVGEVASSSPMTSLGSTAWWTRAPSTVTSSPQRAAGT